MLDLMLATMEYLATRSYVSRHHLWKRSPHGGFDKCAYAPRLVASVESEHISFCGFALWP